MEKLKIVSGLLIHNQPTGYVAGKNRCSGCSKNANCQKQGTIHDYTEEPMAPTGLQFGRVESDESDIDFIDQILTRNYKDEETRELPMLPIFEF
jgi:hypothetical protein